MKKISFCIILLLVMTGAGTFVRAQADSPVQSPCESPDEAARLTKLNNGQELVLFEGELIRIELPSLGSAGYSWQISAHDPQHLQLVSRQTRKINDDPMIVGAPEETLWCFKALATGWTELRMDYYRPWEGLARATDRFELRIMIIRSNEPKSR